MSTQLLALCALLCAVPVTAQIPRDPTPYPYPQRVPQQQPLPGVSRRGQKKQAAEQEATKTVAADGVLTEIKDAAWTVLADDTRYLVLKVNASTRFRRDSANISPDTVQIGDRVHIVSVPDNDQNLTATLISILKPQPKPEEPVETLEITPRAVTPASAAKPGEPDDPDRPHITRGIPKQKPRSEPAPQTEKSPEVVATVRPPVKAPESDQATGEVSALAPAPAEAASDPLLQRAKAVALAFTSTLPNFEVQQLTTRYQSTEAGRNWTAQDTVTADVTYRSGKEDYKNIRINNKLINKDMMDIPGARSTGEFGTTLVSLFAPASHTEFKKLREVTMANRTTMLYSYGVRRVNSDYRIWWGSQWILPAYSGRVWIDKETSRVLRIELQADDIPVEFPLDKMEAVIDYGAQRLGSESFILPIAAENLTCLRGTRLCGRNALSFRNYRLYKSDAIITFDAK